MSIRFDRLKMIAADVRRASVTQFDMGSWECGTSACAIGWHLRFHKESTLRLVQLVGDHKRPKYKGLIEFEAVAAYLEIDLCDAEDLFGLNDDPDDKNITPEFVARRIEAFIAAHRESPVIEMKPSAAAPVAARQLEGEGT